ncbi:cerebellin-1-like [Polymixia lowei]
MDTKAQGDGKDENQTSSDLRQDCRPDIYAVMGELTALTAEQKVELKHVQSELEALTARLQASEDQVEDLVKEKAAQAVELLALKSKLLLIENQVEDLKRDKETKVAFSVALLDTGEGYTGPFNTDITVVYKHVILNIGKAYNQNTGIFTAPDKGVYMIKATNFDYGSSHGAAAGLIKNGQHVVSIYGRQAANTVNAANGATLLLEVGDVVYIRLGAGHRLYDNQHHHTTFSGHLLFTM